MQALTDRDFGMRFNPQDLGDSEDVFSYGAAPPAKTIIAGQDSLVGLYGDEISGTMEIPHVRCDNCNRTLIKLSTIYIDRLQKIQAKYEREGRSMTHKEFSIEQGIILDEIAPTPSILAIERKNLKPRLEVKPVGICCRKNIQEQILIRRDIGPDTKRFVEGHIPGKIGHRRVGNVAVIRSDIGKRFEELPLYNPFTYRSSTSRLPVEDTRRKKPEPKKSKAASRVTDGQRKSVFDPTDIDPDLFPVMPALDNDFVKETLPEPKDYLPNRRLIGVMLPGENIQIPMTNKGIKL
jgi:hypothetical protein